jgi:hypothetical protein
MDTPSWLQQKGIKFLALELELLQLTNWSDEIWKLYNIRENQLSDRMVTVIGNFGGPIHV